MPSARLNNSFIHPLQTREWGRYCQKLGFKVVRRIFKQTKGKQTAIQVLIQKSAVRNYNLAYVPRAPLPDQKQLAYLKALAKKNSCLSLKIEPCCGWFHPMTRVHKLDRLALEKKIYACRGIPSRGIYSKHTLLLPLNAPDSVLLNRMHHKTRYNIRLSERKGVVVSQDNSDKCFEEFLHLFFKVTVVRAEITYPHSPKTLRLFWTSMKSSGMLHLLKATYQGETVAIMMLLKAGDRLYFPHGASSRNYKNVMANYALMWKAIQFGKEIGCSFFDFWGVDIPASKPLTPGKANGLFRFYSGFGAKIFEWLGAYDFIF